MPSPRPVRDRKVYFVGAGLSSAYGLPNTAALLTETIKFAASTAWLRNEDLEGRLKEAFVFFYPDAQHAGFQPDVVDFFSTLRTYLEVGEGLTGTGFKRAGDFYRLLRRAIAHLLIERVRNVRAKDLRSNPYLQEMVKPGNIVITSNWDTLLERFAEIAMVPLRRTSASRRFPPAEAILLKLHGSVDWCQNADRVRSYNYARRNYVALRELSSLARPYRLPLPRQAAAQTLIRINATTSNNLWSRVRSRAREPYMVTMVTGKADDLGPLQDVWRDAYRALSRAETLEIVGYSMPPDDIEIRTIVRTGLQRKADKEPVVRVKNPSPDVHGRVRAYLDRFAEADYLPVPGL